MPNDNPATGRVALAGIRVLDLADNAVAYASRLLADLGAEVIRIEPPQGSALRRAAPLAATAHGAESCAHAFWNANKKAVTLDLSCADGRRLFGDLVAKSDVVIETFAPGTLSAWGIGYDTMRDRNPGIILVSVTPYGQTGPCAKFHATDLTLLAAGGLLSLGGYPEIGPVAVAGEQGFLASAIFGAVATLKALLERQNTNNGGTNHGQWLDVSGQECIAFALEDAIPEWYLSGSIRRRTGDQAREAGTGVYPCQDGYISMVAGRLGTAKAFKTLVQWIADSGTPGGAELLDERWHDFKFRQSPEGIARFAEIFGAFCATRSKQELYREGQEKQIAIAPVNTVADIVDDPQLRANDYFRSLHDGALGRDLTVPGPPYRLSGTPAALHSAAPASGGHNRAVFVEELGLSEGDLRALANAGVV
ncbi:MAG TPA: CoA transferase [Xanthobacteraceae bacterium]|jgi:crotonobetainyl-CoA:carnitine CoA-transferase CaiB-like acyl-CoA transferase